jgi:hypothetical protein
MMHYRELRWPGSERFRLPSWARWANKVLGKLGMIVAFAPRFDYRKSMMSLEQAQNLQLLLLSCLERRVQGDVVEFGCHMGSTTSVLSGVLSRSDPHRAMHVFDDFSFGTSGAQNIRKVFERNLTDLDLSLPVIHEGDLFHSLPVEFPAGISFLHVDVGMGGDQEHHSRLVRHCLECAYPRMSPGAIGVLMDYHVPGLTVGGFDGNPGVRLAADAFFADKPEKVYTLYGGPCSHGWFCKS